MRAKLAALILLAGCASPPMHEDRLVPADAESKSSPKSGDRRPERNQDQSRNLQNNNMNEQGDEAPRDPKEPRAGIDAIKADSPHEKVPEVKQGDPAREPERTFALPGNVVLSERKELGERPVIAVAFVRGERLVRSADQLRRLGQSFEQEAVFQAIELAKEAPGRLALEDLVSAAKAQGATHLIIDARGDARGEGESKTTLLVHASTGDVVSYTRPAEAEPTSADLVARLVRAVRKETS
jgi:hypothetical protein